MIQNNKVELVLNNTKIHTIKELKEHFNAEEVMNYHLKGDLLRWLEQHYYENEAAAVKAIAPDQPGCIQKICSALGIPDPSIAGFSEKDTKAVAVSNGYDDFQENHTSLATAFHKQLKSRKIINNYHLTYNSYAFGKYYTSKSECKKARDHFIRKAYDEAEKYLTTGNSKSLSKEAATFYSNQICSVFEDTRKPLETLCSIIGTSDQYQKLMEKVDKSYQSLLSEFDSELDDNQDYYSMYDFDYFIDQVEIEEHDHRVYDDFFSRMIETLLTKDSVEYTMTDIYSAIREMENDLNEHTNTFYGAALQIYQEYVSDIEKIIDKIGKGLPAMLETENVEEYIVRCCVKKAV